MNIALVNSSYSIPQSPDFNTTGIAYYNNNGQVRYNSTTLSTIETYTAGDIIYVAVDKVNGKVWFKKNSGNWNNNASANPATNTGGIAVSVSGNLYPLVQLSQNCQITADFTSNTGAPSGFSAFPIQTVVTTTGAGSFTIPAGVTSITVEAWGHGGNGDAQSNQGAGGSGGGYIHVDIPVTAGDVLNWNIPSTTTAVGTVFAKNNSALSTNYWYGGVGVDGSAGTGFGGGNYGSVGSPAGTLYTGFNGGAGASAQGGGGSRAGSGGGGAAGPDGAGVGGSVGAGGTQGAGGDGDNGSGGAGGAAGAGTSNAQGGGGGAGGTSSGDGFAGGTPGGGGGGKGRSGTTGGAGGGGQIRYTYTVSGNTFNQSCLATTSPVAADVARFIKGIGAQAQAAATMTRRMAITKLVQALGVSSTSIRKAVNRAVQITTGPVALLAKLMPKMAQATAGAGVASLGKSYTRLVVGQAQTVPTNSRRLQIGKLALVAVAPSSGVVKLKSMQLIAQTAPVAALVKMAQVIRRVAVSTQAALLVSKQVGRAALANAAAVASRVIAVAKGISASTPPASSVLRQAVKTLLGTSGTSASQRIAAGKKAQAQAATSSSILKGVVKTFTVTSAAVARRTSSLAKSLTTVSNSLATRLVSLQKGIQASSSTSTTSVKLVGKRAQGSTNPVGDLVVQGGRKVDAQALASAIASRRSVIAKAFAVSTQPVVSFAEIAVRVVLSQASAGVQAALTRLVSVKLIAQAVTTPSLTRFTALTRRATTAPVGSVVRVISKKLQGSASGISGLVKGKVLSLAASAGTAGSLATILGKGVVAHAQAAVSMAAARVTSIHLLAAGGAVARLSRLIGVFRQASTSPQAALARVSTRLGQATSTATASLKRTVSLRLQAAASVASTVARSMAIRMQAVAAGAGSLVKAASLSKIIQAAAQAVGSLKMTTARHMLLQAAAGTVTGMTKGVSLGLQALAATETAFDEVYVSAASVIRRALRWSYWL
jgi:hypothetical protein